MKWPVLHFPPVNLFSLPDHLLRPLSCQHTHWAIFHGDKKRVCIDCGKNDAIDNYFPGHQR